MERSQESEHSHEGECNQGEIGQNSGYSKSIFSFLYHYMWAILLMSNRTRLVLMDMFKRRFFPERPKLSINRTRSGKVLGFDFQGAFFNILIPKGKIYPFPEKITDENGEDVTSKVAPFMGPNNDFYISSAKANPKMLGYKTLQFHFGEGDVYVATGDETFYEIFN